MRPDRAGRRLALWLLAASATLALGCDGLVLYTVQQAPVEDCVIRSNGEFCDDDDQLPEPSIQRISVELLDTHTILYIEDETWVAEGVEGERDIAKSEQTIRNRCTTTVRREMLFNEDGESFTGTFEEAVRVEGPESCGETPFGSRKLYQLTGSRSDSL